MSNPKDDNNFSDENFNLDDMSFDDLNFDSEDSTDSADSAQGADDLDFGSFDFSEDATEEAVPQADSFDSAESADFADFASFPEEEPVGVFGESLGGQDVEETVLGTSVEGIEGVAPIAPVEEEDPKGKKKKKEKAPKAKKEKPPKKEKAPKVKKEKAPKVKKEKPPKAPKKPRDPNAPGLRIEEMAALGACALIAIVFLAINALVIMNGGFSMTNIGFLIGMDIIAVVMILVPFFLYKRANAEGAEKVDVFHVFLGASVLALCVGLLYLLAEWKAYDFTVKAAKANDAIVSFEKSNIS